MHFTIEDLGRVVLAGRGVPVLSETVLSLQSLRRPDRTVRDERWRCGLRGRLPSEVGRLLSLVPSQGWIPDFLTPDRNAFSLSGGLETIRDTPARQISAELQRLAAAHRLPPWAESLALGGKDGLTTITDALAAYHEIAVAPHVAGMRGVLDADRARRMTVTSDRGVSALLMGLHPAITWDPPVLRVPAPFDGDVHLAGRGIVLSPLIFCGPLPRLLVNNSHDRPLLAYPPTFDTVRHPFAALDPDHSDRHAEETLARVLGATRAAILLTIAPFPGLTTAAVATRACVSLSSASEHATTLREAGLVISHRDGNRVRHHATDAAMALLAASGAKVTPARGRPPIAEL
ncbi:ArsR/SmtB family transcription factor [Actinokineospora sp. HUAS TT18]|uniref:ArsR/SmtB family transcription factor n=1 Tax=Actinokineospora sp. HUAS TT18 TaxID=3447451 RepID=UPI003F51E08A